MCFIRDNITDLHRLISKKKVTDIYKLLYGGTKERKEIHTQGRKDGMKIGSYVGRYVGRKEGR